LVYPNPTDGAFFILLKDNEDGEKIYINVFDISERLINIGQTAISGENNLFYLNLGHAYPGLCMVQIYSDKGERFVKELIIQ